MLSDQSRVFRVTQHRVADTHADLEPIADGHLQRPVVGRLAGSGILSSSVVRSSLSQMNRHDLAGLSALPGKDLETLDQDQAGGQPAKHELPHHRLLSATNCSPYTARRQRRLKHNLDGPILGVLRHPETRCSLCRFVGRGRAPEAFAHPLGARSRSSQHANASLSHH
jgi:hypothetical protein